MATLIRSNGAFVRYNGAYATDPDLCDCECGDDECCCDNLTDMYVEATVGSCYATGKMTREADGSYAGSRVKLWTAELNLGGSILFVAVQCWDGGCELRFYSDTCSGVDPNYDGYDPTYSGWNRVDGCPLPQTFNRPGACNNTTCGIGQTLVFTIAETAF